MFGSFFAVVKLYLLLLAVYCWSRRRLERHNTQVFERLVGGDSQHTSLTLVIAHPDDEVMFFAPTLLQLDARLPAWMPFRVVCLTDGGAEGLGQLRRAELQKALRLLVLEHDVTLEVADFTDGMKEDWDLAEVRTRLGELVTDAKPLVLTFDERGVSGHRNHIGCALAAARLGHKTLFLRSERNLLRKYSFFVLDVFRVVFGTPPPTVFVSTLAQYLHALVAMVVAHRSQMVWFRWGWWMASRYVYANEY
ncbi:ABL120Wp [Eremothecium gossypii ATCC 10895]|uniref:N-acetylglucosaminylphosphatidylinositol deacetylase n=1 Tax=Eremothecium gossypii (strain ATCC 10895 / CBS 109.51 / FGSC 9923 / NRRL Y-1056) TaxID=284811 RepID=Q75DZ3_EREGS|nr:ABL120Wp [Eremothecium gossypii ATCC 10895]AAS50651.1 ABL120Wp [Eremothecium gossypii ATCC 10895]AEY94939.1 FABL120Wp [Eremothecium gossypii FDAG1]